MKVASPAVRIGVGRLSADLQPQHRSGPCAKDSLLEGDGFEPSVPGDKPWVQSSKMANFCKCLPAGYPTVRRCGDVRLCALVKGEHGLAPLSPCRPSLVLGVELPLDAFFARRPKAGLAARDQRFESVSLQRRVNNEPCPSGLRCGPVQPRSSDIGRRERLECGAVRASHPPRRAAPATGDRPSSPNVD